MSANEIKGYCTLCRSRCGTLNRVENDSLISVRPDPDHPTGSAMCMKGKAAPEIVHSPHRLMHPMKRTRPKTDADPGWVRIGWEEALATTAGRLGAIRAESGAEAVAFAVTTPSGTPLSDSIDWIERFVRLFGSPNTVYATEVCNWHKDYAHAFTFGCGLQPPDYANADTIVLWGHNPANTWLAQANNIGIGRSRGAKLVVVDPRPTALAKQADVWLQVRPGTDTVLAMAISRRIIELGRYDRDFVRQWSNGPFLVRKEDGALLRERALWPASATDRHLVWDSRFGAPVPYDADRALGAEASAALMLEGSWQLIDATGQTIDCETAFTAFRRQAGRYSAEEVFEITGVPDHQIDAAAEHFVGGKRLAYYSWNGVGQHTNATQTDRALATLYALNGSFDVVGGNRRREGPQTEPMALLSLLPEARRAKALGLAERPIGPPAHGWVMARDVYRAILEQQPYPVRAMMAFGTNMPVSHGDTAMAMQALEQLEFHVHLDLFETPASRYADILLPVNSPWEHEGLRVGFEIDDAAAAHVQFRERMISPRGESRSDNEIVFDLATRLGMERDFFGGDLHAAWARHLAPSGMTLERLRRSPGGIRMPIDAAERKYSRPDAQKGGTVPGFDTPTRRVEFYSERLLQHGQPAVPTYLPGAEERRERKRAGSGGGGDFPLLLSSAKNGYYCHSQHRGLASLRKRAPDPAAEISPGLAASRGLRDGDWMQVSTRVGRARFIVRITPGLADDVVVAEFGWWESCTALARDGLTVMGVGSSNFNSLISADEHDPVSGSVAMRSFRCDIAPDPTVPAGQRRWVGWRPFRVAALVPEAAGVLSIHFEATEPGPLPDFLPGQHAQIRLHDGTQTIGRAYSLTGSAEVPGRRGYSIAVRHQKGRDAQGVDFEGQVSGYLHRHLVIGQIVELQAPSGGFVLPRRSAQPLVLLAGGIGITPFINLLETLPDGDPLEMWLYYANLDSRSHAFRARLAEHAGRLPGLRVFDYYSRPLPTDTGYAGAGYIGAQAVGDELIARRARVYMCGPPALMNSFADGLVARGMPRFDIFREVFRSPPAPMADDGRSFVVRFLKSLPEGVPWTASQGPLLPFAEANGLKLANGCRVGQCESCAVRIVSGKVRHLHGSEPEEAGFCLTCQAVPTEDLVLDA